MTACVNKHTKRVAAVVTASLVGALSLGVAPVAAMAEDISLQSVSATDALEGGTLTGAVDIENNPIEIPATGEIAFTADGKPQGVVPTEVTMAAGSATKKVDLNVFEYSLEYYIANSNFVNTGTLVNGNGSAPVQVGKYIAKLTITEAGDYNDVTISVPFEIKAATLQDVSVVDTVDGSFEFDGLDQLDNMAFKIGDKFADMSQFTIKGITYKKGDKFPSESATDAVYPGDYSMVIVGNAGTIYAGSETEVKFTVTPLDLAKATIVINDVVVSSMGNSYEPAIDSINGDKLAGNSVLAAEVQSVFKSGPDGSNLVWKRGEYTYTVTPKTDNGYVENSQDVTFVATDSDLAYFMYQGAAFPGNLSINLSNGESFTGDKIQVFKADGTQLNDGEYSVTVTNVATGETSSDLDLVNTPGNWVVTAKVNAAAMDYTLGGSASITVNTIAGEVKTDANIYFIYDGKIVSGSKSIEYDGTDKLDNLQVVVTDTYGNVLSEGDDYKIVVKDKAGNVIDEAVDAGEYVISVESDSYTIDASSDLNGGAQLDLTVTPAVVKAVRVATGDFFVAKEDVLDENGKVTGQSTRAFLPYTGSAIVPSIEYQDSDGAWHALPSDLYTLTYMYSATENGSYTKVDSMKAAGYYKIYLHAVRSNDENWDLKSSADSNGFFGVKDYLAEDEVIEVSADRVYTDVPSTHWAAQNIYDATELGYMSGYNGTTFFGADDNIKRGDVAVVLYKMAGSPVPTWLQEDYKDANGGYVTGFDDVNSNMYYAQAIAWAKGVGIVSGDTGTGLFRPEDTISRQELAKMLCVYAEKTGKDTDVDTDAVLSAYDDADTVADWAEDYVAWCVEADIMGQNSPLRGSDPITRAEVATMAIRLQPKKLDDSLVGNFGQQ